MNPHKRIILLLAFTGVCFVSAAQVQVLTRDGVTKLFPIKNGTLDIESVNIVRIADSPHMPQVKRLVLRFLSIDDPSTISGFANLEELEMFSVDDKSDYRFLAKMHKLKSFWVEGDNLLKVRIDLSKCHNLEILSLTNCSLDNLDKVIVESSSLKLVNLWSNRLKIVPSRFLDWNKSTIMILAINPIEVRVNDPRIFYDPKDIPPKLKNICLNLSSRFWYSNQPFKRHLTPFACSSPHFGGSSAFAALAYRSLRSGTLGPPA